MKPMHSQDPWIFIRKTLENAFDKEDNETILRMSALIDNAMIQYAEEHADGVYAHFAHRSDCAENA